MCRPAFFCSGSGRSYNAVSLGFLTKTTECFPGERFSRDGFAISGGVATDKQRSKNRSDLPLGEGDPAWLRLSDVKCHSRLQPAACRLSEEVDSKVKNRPAHSRRWLKVTFGCEGQRLNFPRAEWERSGQVEEGIQQEEWGCDGARPSVRPSSRSSCGLACCFFFSSFFSRRVLSSPPLWLSN